MYSTVRNGLSSAKRIGIHNTFFIPCNRRELIEIYIASYNNRVFISFTKQFFTFHSNRVKCEKQIFALGGIIIIIIE